MRTERQLYERLRGVSDPALGGDIVSLGLLTDVRVDDGRAIVTLAFEAPFSPVEWRMCDEVRALCRGVGLEPHVYADPRRSLAERSGVKNVVTVGGRDPESGVSLVAANLAASFDAIGARVGVFDCRLETAGRSWLQSAAPLDPASESTVPAFVGGIPVVRLGPTVLTGDAASAATRELPTIVESIDWGALDYLFVVLPRGTGPVSARVLAAVPTVGTVVVASAAASADRIRSTVAEFEAPETPILGVVATTERAGPDGGPGVRVDGIEPAARSLGTVPRDRCTSVTTAEPVAERTAGPVDPRGGEAPYRDLARSIADCVGAVNRRRVARRRGAGSVS